MTAEEAFAEAYAELDAIKGVRLVDGNVELTRKLRILPANEPPKESNAVGIAVIVALFWIALWAGLRLITFLAGRYL